MANATINATTYEISDGLHNMTDFPWYQTFISALVFLTFFAATFSRGLRQRLLQGLQAMLAFQTARYAIPPTDDQSV